MFVLSSRFSPQPRLGRGCKCKKGPRCQKIVFSPLLIFERECECKEGQYLKSMSAIHFPFYETFECG